MLAENQLILKKNYYIYHWNRFQEKNKAKKTKAIADDISLSLKLKPKY